MLANDRDPEGATLTAILVDGPQYASSFTLNPNGTFTYRHNGLSRQTDSFTYRAFDGSVASAVTTVTITISDPPPPPHQNPINPSDVNADGFVSPIDVLLIVNFINANGNGVSVSTLPPPPPFRDVDGDNRITPNDILRVINTINQLRAGGEGEGASFLGSSIDVSAGVTDSLGMELLGAGMGAPEIVSRTVGNTRIGMRDMQVTDRLYGPAQPALHAVLMELERADLTRSMADLSWLMDEPMEESELPIDLALASLLGDVDEGEL